MNILIAPDKFKDCLSAQSVTQIIERTLMRSNHSMTLQLLPLGDGGEGQEPFDVSLAHGKEVTQRHGKNGDHVNHVAP